MTTESTVAAHIRTVLSGAPHSLSASNCRPGPPKKPTENQSVPGSIPSRCVFVLSTGGIQPTAFIDGGNGGKDERLTFQIWIRSNPRDYEGGAILANAVYSAIDMNPPTGFYEARARTSEPMYLRQDEQNHHEWSINVVLNRCP